MSPDLNNQPGIISTEQRSQSVFLYAAALPKEAESGPAMRNVVNSRINKWSCIVLYDTPIYSTSEFPKINEQKRVNTGEVKANERESIIISETVTTWRDELQDKTTTTGKHISDQVNIKHKALEATINQSTNQTLNEFNNTLLTEVVRIISNQIATQVSILNPNMIKEISHAMFINNRQMNLALIQPIAQPQSLPKTNRYTAYASNVIAPTKDANLEE